MKKSKTMMMPGFDAEAVFVKNRAHYRTAENAAIYSGDVQPAMSRFAGLPCLKFHFTCADIGPCHWVTSVGHINAMGQCQ